MKSLFITYKKPIAVILALLIMGGVYVYLQFQTSLFPEITFPKIKIIADAGLQPVDKMMVTVTRPLENAIKQIPDLLNIRSTTSRGTCEISAFIDWNADVNLSQQRIEARVTEIRNLLPPEVRITVEKMNPSILPIMGYSLESHSLTPIELKKLATYVVKPFLSQVEGISEVRIIGGKEKEYWVQLDPQKMSTLSVTPDNIANALAQTNFVKSNGYLADYRRLYLTVTDATLKTIDELRDIVIVNNSHRIILLKDIADITVSEAVEFIKINANGKDGLLIAIIKQPNTNLVSVSKKMAQKIEDLKKFLPQGVTIRPYYVQSDFVRESVKSVTDSLWIGLALAIIVAIIFLRSFKASSTILITIPITLCLTMIVMYIIGYTLNIMTLGAIAAAIGLIIDDAIVVVEQIHRTHEEHPNEQYSPIVQKSIQYLFPAMIGSSLSTIVIFLPFMLMSGVAGEYFKVMTNTMIITLLSSFFVTWIGLPIVYLLLSRKKKKEKLAKIQEVHEVKIQGWVPFFVRRPWISLIMMAGMLLIIFLILPQLKTGFLPEMDEGSIVMDYQSPPGTSLIETDMELQQVDKIINTIPDVEAFSRRTGTQMGFFITEPNRGDYLIQLKKNRKHTTDEVIAAIRSRVETTQPALRVDFGQVIGDMLGDLMTSVQPIEIKIFGNDHTVLQDLSRKVAAIVEKTEGTADVFDGITITGPTIDIRPYRTQLSQNGITANDFQYQVQNSLEGNLIGNIFENDQLTPVRLVYPGTKQRTVDDLKKLQIFLPGGTLKPISVFAIVALEEGKPEIERENLQSMGVISARLEGRDLGSVIKDIKSAIKTRINIPGGYHIEYGGEYAEQQKSFRELLMILIASCLLVFGVILFLYREFYVALLILIIAVLGISGSYLGLYLTGTALNVGSYTGLIMIVGIIGENAIFTVLQFRESVKEKSVKDSINYAISTRLRPKLMTALGAIIALLPLALGIGTGAELHQPLAIAVIGGFIMALPLLLIVLPSMLGVIYRKGYTFEGNEETAI